MRIERLLFVILTINYNWKKLKQKRNIFCILKKEKSVFHLFRFYLLMFNTLNIKTKKFNLFLKIAFTHVMLMKVTYFHEKWLYFPKQNKIVGKVTLFDIFANLFNIWLHRKLLGPLCFYIQSAVMVLAEVYKRNWTSHGYATGKERSIVQAFSCHCLYALKLYQTAQVLVSEGLVAVWNLKPCYRCTIL